MVGRRVWWWLLETLMLGAVLLLYPALGVITSLRAQPSGWGPVVLILLGIGRILLRVALVS